MIYGLVLLPPQRAQVRADTDVDAPWMWRHYQQMEIARGRAVLEALEASYTQIGYAEQVIGDGRSRSRIASLAKDPRYVELTRRAASTAAAANRTARRTMDAKPRPARWLWNDPINDEFRAHTSSEYQTRTIEQAVLCAQADLAGARRTSECAHLLTYVPEPRYDANGAAPTTTPSPTTAGTT